MSAEWQWERPDTLGSRLRFLRESFGLKAATAAMAVGFDDQSWRNWENGVHTPSPEKVERIARRFEGSGEEEAKRLAAWLAFGGPLPPAPQPSDPFTMTNMGRDVARTENPKKRRNPTEGRNGRRVKDTPSYLSGYDNLHSSVTPSKSAGALRSAAA
jgi:DNA-binding XRE family transcriptional regulator